LTRVEDQLGSKAILAESKMKDAWLEFDSEDSDDKFQKGLAEQLLAAGCAADGASYVIHGLLNELRQPVRPALAARFIEQRHCAASYGLSEADQAHAREIREAPTLSVTRGKAE
jgi:hypothetical protein